ncbi:DUF1311 domain-containing protein [Estrella lausannensis]|uniref:Uncharacterized protein n=1 Tax=Estrella lausannensis TaxID=483423 RepID=A0A0H5DQF0_9BACT|nr:DUF1311 domain-containing protein [Estrella lausannensis]CRX38747.1 hypothetical protein ELAC_1411 [Estrella lausannensis]
MNSLSECLVDGRPKGFYLPERPTDPVAIPELSLDAGEKPQQYPANIFFKLRSKGHIDAQGLANPSLIELKLPLPPPSSSKRLNEMAKTVLVFPDKKLAEIPEKKRELVERSLAELRKGWNLSGMKRKFPFTLNKERTHLSIHVSFCYRELLEFIEELPFVKSIECYGGALPYILGEQYFDTVCSSLAEERDEMSCLRADNWLLHPDDLDLAVECSSNDFDPYMAEERILSFLAGKIPHTEEEGALLNIILRETAFKNIFISHADFKNPQTLISFHNKCGIDIDLTFSTKIIRTPFTLCHGLRAFLSFKRRGEELARPFCEGVNPYQCLFDKMAGVYRVFEKAERASFERRIPWLLQAMSKGGTLVLGEKREWMKEGLCSALASHEICRMHRKFDSDEARDFGALIDALNGLSFLMEDGCVEPGCRLLELTCREIEQNFSEKVKEEEWPLKIIRGVALKGNEAGNALLSLQGALLYLLPFFQSGRPSLLYEENALNGKTLLILHIPYNRKNRGLQLPISLNASFSRQADEWLSLLLQDATLAEEGAERCHLEAVKKSSNNEIEGDLKGAESRIGHAYACEIALLDVQGVNWRGFLETRALTYLLANPSFEERIVFVRRIGERLQADSGNRLSGLENALKEKKSKKDVAKRFLCDVAEVSETATHAMKEGLLDELWSELKAPEREEVLEAFIGHLMIRNRPLAASFLKSGEERGFPFSKTAPFHQAIVKSQEIALEPFRVYSARQIVRRMIDETAKLPLIATADLLFTAIRCLHGEDKSELAPLLLKAAIKGYRCPVEEGVIACVAAEMDKASNELDEALISLLEKGSPDLIRALFLQFRDSTVNFLSRLFHNGSKLQAYQILRRMNDSSWLGEIDLLREIFLFGLDYDVIHGKGMEVLNDLEKGSLAGLAPSLKMQTTIQAAECSFSQGNAKEAAYALSSLLRGVSVAQSDSRKVTELIEKLIKHSIEIHKGEQPVQEYIKEILFHPRLVDFIGKRAVCSLFFQVAECGLGIGKEGYFDLFDRLLPLMAALVWDQSEPASSGQKFLHLVHSVLSHPQKRVFAKKKPSQQLLNYLYQVLPREMKRPERAELLFEYIELILDCERFPARDMLSIALAALSFAEGDSFQKGVQVVLKICPPQLNKLELQDDTQEVAAGLRRLASSSLCQLSAAHLIVACKLGLPLFSFEEQRAERSEFLQNLKSAGLSHFKEIKDVLAQSGFLPSSEEVVDLISGLLLKATDEEIVKSVDLLFPYIEQSPRLLDCMKKELSFSGEHLLDCAIRLEISDAFADLVTLFDLHSFSAWKAAISLLDRQSKKMAAAFIGFFTASCGQVNADNARDYLKLLGKLTSQNKIARHTFSLNFLEEAMNASSFLEGDEALSAKVMALDAYFLSIQKSQSVEQMTAFWKWRETLIEDDVRVYALDVQFLMLTASPVRTECVTSWLNAALRLYRKDMVTRTLSLKALAFLESLNPSEEWNDLAYALSRHLLEDCHLKKEERVRVMKAVNPFLILFQDALSLYKSVYTVLEAVENREFVPKGASAEIPLSETLALMPLDFASQVLEHRQLTCIFSSAKIKEATGSFLFETISSALIHQNREEVLRALLEYQNYFFRLEIGSVREREITTLILQLYAFLIGVDKSNKICIGHFTKLATETMKRANLPQFADIALDVILWCPDRPVKREGTKESIKSHISHKQLQKYKERFFEIAKEMVNVFLSIPSNGEEQDSAILKACVSLVSHIMMGNADRGERLLPEFEKLMFTPLSMGSYSLFVGHLRECRRILTFCIERGYLKANAELFYTSLLLLENKEWMNNPLTKEKKKESINNVFDFLFNSGKYYVVHQAVCIMQTSSLLLFQQDDTWRASIFLRLIEEAFNYPRSRVVVVSFDGGEPYGKMGREAPHLQIDDFFTPKEQVALKKEGGVLLEEFLVTTVAECMVNDERQIIHVQKGSSVDTAFSLISNFSQKMKALIQASLEEGNDPEELLRVLFKFLTRCRKFQLFPSDEAFFALVEECSAGAIFDCITSSKALLESFGALIRSLINDPDVRLRRLELYHRIVKVILRYEDINRAVQGKMFLEEGIKANVYQGRIQTISGDHELKELLDKLIK